MKIKGFQKVTLIDYPEKIASTIFIFGCNFKCGFCHNPELVVKENNGEYSKKEILEYLEKRKKYIEGVCITGGEPLLTIDTDFLRSIKQIGYQIKLDTNGSFPERLKGLIEGKLIDFVAMDIKSTKEKYNSITNTNADIKKIEESIKIISRLKEYEFRTTVIEDLHTKEDVKKIAKWLNEIAQRKPKKYILQGFKNNRKFIDENFNSKKDTTKNYLEELKKETTDYFESVEIRE